MAKTRNLGAGFSEAGTFSLWIEVCEAVGAGNVCAPAGLALKSPSSIQWTIKSDSQRTLSASVLTAGANKLKPLKTYAVRVKGRVDLAGNDATASYKNAVMAADLPLLWFDADGSGP
jgi:hypothetical protein